MLGANDEIFFPSMLTSSLYIGQSLFPDTRVFVFARQFMDQAVYGKKISLEVLERLLQLYISISAKLLCEKIVVLIQY